MTAIPITCDNCGAKYRLPATFAGATATCQKCGSAIDVAAQRAGDDPTAAVANAAAKPAAARPAMDRSKLARPAATAARPERTGRRSAADAPGKRARPDRSPGKPRSVTPLVLAGIGFAVLGLIVWRLLA